ncbi:MAG: glycosyltransferase N-terminal domain-containing protein, partial [bacterium]|nr:glycosyltransferase N-terminal domain-containing protein [bacterium]
MVFYNIILDIFFVPFFLLLMTASLFNARLRKTFFRRIGLYRVRSFSQRPVWFHCSSLGEFNAIKNMVLELKNHGYEIFVSLLTDTGFESAEKFLGQGHVCVLPLDFHFLIKPLVRKVNACLLVIEETEIWPNLITQSAKASIPIIYTNAIISQKSYSFYSCLSMIFKPVLGLISLFFVQNQKTGAYLRELGVKQKKIRYEGNIKFDLRIRQKLTPSLLKQRLGLSHTLVFTAGSTRPGEEELLLGAFQSLKGKFKSLKL